MPHAWEAGLLFDKQTSTLFCGDLFSGYGDPPATTTDDIVACAIAAEDAMPSLSLHPATASIIRGLADLRPERLALMHGPVFVGDCETALLALAADVESRIAGFA